MVKVSIGYFSIYGDGPEENYLPVTINWEGKRFCLTASVPKDGYGDSRHGKEIIILEPLDTRLKMLPITLGKIARRNNVETYQSIGGNLIIRGADSRLILKLSDGYQGNCIKVDVETFKGRDN